MMSLESQMQMNNPKEVEILNSLAVSAGLMDKLANHKLQPRGPISDHNLANARAHVAAAKTYMMACITGDIVPDCPGV